VYGDPAKLTVQNISSKSSSTLKKQKNNIHFSLVLALKMVQNLRFSLPRSCFISTC